MAVAKKLQAVGYTMYNLYIVSLEVDKIEFEISGKG